MNSPKYAALFCLLVIVSLGPMTRLRHAVASQGASDSTGSIPPVISERQPVADLGNGYYVNPILPGNRPDPSVIRVGKDYYLVYSDTQPRGFLLWHSRDLVNWKPVSRISLGMPDEVGLVLAPDFVHYNDAYYIYFPAVEPQRGRLGMKVLHAKSLDGPWSKAIDLGIESHSDPGHIADDQGNRYLYVGGHDVAPLSPDGLSLTGPLRHTYSGWQYPKEWVTECFCLESPKLLRRGEYYYLISAEGGTSGPSTSHMVVAARSNSPLGPWEDSPYNPVLHTALHSERWWSQGHGTLVDDIDGNWWLIYHAIENGYRSLGRQVLLMPIEWTQDGWPRIAGEISSAGLIRKPPGENIGNGIPLSDDFLNPQLGLQWNYRWEADPASTYQPGQGELRMKSRGASMKDAALLVIEPMNHAYEAQVEAECSDCTEAGIVIVDQNYVHPFEKFAAASIRKAEISAHFDFRTRARVDWNSNRAFLKIRDDHHDISLYYSSNGKDWTSFDVGRQLDGVENLRVGLYAEGSGTAIFRQFRYRGIE